MKRIYETAAEEQFRFHRQMVFLSGPRQVGKTTSAAACAGRDGKYFNWDNQRHRIIITSGADALAGELGLDELRTYSPVVIFDELHKYGKWKSFLKGFFDLYQDRCRVLVTGSARLNVYKRGGDSLMGRYFLYRMHPLSIGEIRSAEFQEKEILKPEKPEQDILDHLIRFSGFPEPFLKGSLRFYNRWKRLSDEQFVQEDVRDLTQISEIGQLSVLMELLRSRIGSQVNFSRLAREVNVSADTAIRWIQSLEYLYYCFTVRPWFRNVPKSLRKQPKIYLWDWSLVSDKGARYENFTASVLLKSVNWWTDMGLGDYKLFYVRDKAKREVDFLVVRNNKPWFLVEVKSSGKKRLNPSLNYFHEILGTDHAFQVSFDAEYADSDCFSVNHPVIVPAETLFSQLA